VACDDCKLEERVKALEQDSGRNQTTHREFYSKFEGLAVQTALTDERYAAIMTSLAKLETVIEELKGKPGKRWETMVQSTLQWLVVAVLGAIVLFR
jgi:predicted branched-subunit amino acid permease